MLGIVGWFGKWLHSEAAAGAAEPQASFATEPVAPVHVEQSAWNEGLRLFDEFEVERQLGAGGLGPVYLVRNTNDGRAYIVKRVAFRDDEARNEFLAQLQAWVYLPEHPHLGACRFIRVHGNEADVFSEPLEGASLKELIRTRKLYAGDKRAALERILDIAIQMAWGLQALEDLKLLHGNLKPTDVFVSSNGIVRITSMGLARAVSKAYCADGKPAEKPSPVYASPEVTDGGEITEASDLWCWGLIVFEMFAGAVLWGEAPPDPKSDGVSDDGAKRSLEQLRAVGKVPEWGGRTGLQALETYLKGPAPEKPLPVMPNAVAAILRRCFAPRLEDRWNSAIEVARELRLAYRQHVGREHPRRAPTALHRGHRLIVAHARWSRASGAQWLSLGEWEERIERALGRPAPVWGRRAASALGLKAQASHDHTALYALQKRCEGLIASGHTELRHELAGLCMDHGFLHVGLQNIPKALECFEQAIRVWDELVTGEQRDELQHELAMAHLNRGIALKQMGRLREALAGYERAIELWKSQVSREGRRELAATLGWAEASRAKVLFKLAFQARANALELSRQAQELQARVQERNAETRALRSRVAALNSQIGVLGSEQGPPPMKSRAGSKTAENESAARQVERQMAAQAAKSELARLQEALKTAEEWEVKAKTRQQEARAADADAKALQKRAESEARAALSVLQAEVKRTDRDDARAVFHWAQRAFEGLL